MEAAAGTARSESDRAPCRTSAYVGNREHHVRDVTFREDAGHVRTGQLPHVPAAIRNLAIGAFRKKGHVNIAQARRRHGHASRRLLPQFVL